MFRSILLLSILFVGTFAGKKTLRNGDTKIASISLNMKKGLFTDCSPSTDHRFCLKLNEPRKHDYLMKVRPIVGDLEWNPEYNPRTVFCYDKHVFRKNAIPVSITYPSGLVLKDLGSKCSIPGLNDEANSYCGNSEVELVCRWPKKDYTAYIADQPSVVKGSKFKFRFLPHTRLENFRRLEINDDFEGIYYIPNLVRATLVFKPIVGGEPLNDLTTGLARFRNNVVYYEEEDEGSPEYECCNRSSNSCICYSTEDGNCDDCESYAEDDECPTAPGECDTFQVVGWS